MALYALPGFEAGVLVGLTPAASAGGGRRRVLLRTVWIANTVHVALVVLFVSRGAVFERVVGTADGGPRHQRR